MMKRPRQISDPLLASHDPLHPSHDPRTACTQDPARVHLSFISAVFPFSQTPFFSFFPAVERRRREHEHVTLSLEAFEWRCVCECSMRLDFCGRCFDGTTDTWSLKRITVGSRRIAQEADFSTVCFTSLFTPVKLNAEKHFSLIYFPRQTIHFYLIGSKYDHSTLFLWWMF